MRAKMIYIRPEQAALLALYLVVADASPIGADSYHDAFSNTLNSALLPASTAAAPNRPLVSSGIAQAYSVAGVPSVYSGEGATVTKTDTSPPQRTDNCDDDTRRLLFAASQYLPATRLNGIPYMAVPSASATQAIQNLAAAAGITPRPSMTAQPDTVSIAGKYLDTTCISSQTFVGIPLSKVMSICSRIAYETASPYAVPTGPLTIEGHTITPILPSGPHTSAARAEEQIGSIGGYGYGGEASPTPLPVSFHIVSSSAGGIGSAPTMTPTNLLPVTPTNSPGNGIGHGGVTFSNTLPVISQDAVPTNVASQGHEPYGFALPVTSNNAVPSNVETYTGGVNSDVPASAHYSASSEQAVPTSAIASVGQSPQSSHIVTSRYIPTNAGGYEQSPTSIVAGAHATGFTGEKSSSNLPVTSGAVPTPIAGYGAGASTPVRSEALSSATGYSYDGAPSLMSSAGSAAAPPTESGGGGAVAYKA